MAAPKATHDPYHPLLRKRLEVEDSINVLDSHIHDDDVVGKERSMCSVVDVNLPFCEMLNFPAKKSYIFVTLILLSWQVGVFL